MEQLLNLRNLLQHEIEDLYSAEEQIIEALPLMVESANSPELKKALNEHLKITREQKKRLDRIQQVLNKENKEESEKNKSFLSRLFGGGTKCKGMEGLITEGQKIMAADMDPQVRDAAIIASCQKIEHYEISGYGTARAFANQLSLTEVERLLQTTLNEEYKADDLLTVLALKKVNIDAENEGGRTSSSEEESMNDRSASNRKQGMAKNGSGAKKSAPVKSAAKKSAAKKSAGKKSAPKKSSKNKSAAR